MPPRPITVAIVLCWLATLGWFFQHDLWPRLRPGERPPYTIDLADEVTGPEMPRHWTVFRNGITIGQARTWVERQDDTFVLTSKFNFDRFKVATFAVTVDIQDMKSTYRVTRDGQLKEVDGEVGGAVYGVFLNEVQGSFRGVVHGVVADGKFTPHWKLTAPLPVGRQELDTDPVAVASNHSVLNPMQPWNRLHDLRENRTWRIELFDPLTDSVASMSSLIPGLGKGARVPTLEAGVLQGTEDWTWNGNPVPCLVIEYRGEGVTGKTYVRQSDGLVLRQEATRGDERMALERLPR